MPLDQKFSKADKGRHGAKKSAGAKPLKRSFKRRSQNAEREVKAAFEKWIAAVSTGNADAVSALYAPEAVLLPTLSPKVHDTPEQRREYFTAFTARKDLKGEVNESYIRVFQDTAVNSGMYTFSYQDEAGRTQSVPARFSFVYRRTEEGWMIIDHHSSAAPKDQISLTLTVQDNKAQPAAARPDFKTGSSF
ncbi:MAG: SgcJ/EcaC family oxidoreductase [bacterium]|nr:SgcJ/EcaC family oxidoreductase [bacterium]